MLDLHNLNLAFNNPVLGHLHMRDRGVLPVKDLGYLFQRWSLRLDIYEVDEEFDENPYLKYVSKPERIRLHKWKHTQ